MEIQCSNGGFPLGLSMSNRAVCPEGLFEVEERTLKVTATAHASGSPREPQNGERQLTPAVHLELSPVSLAVAFPDGWDRKMNWGGGA